MLTLYKYPLPARWFTGMSGTAVYTAVITMVSATARAAEPVSTAGCSLGLNPDCRGNGMRLLKYLLLVLLVFVSIRAPTQAPIKNFFLLWLSRKSSFCVCELCYV